ncbi:MAG: hypothetical protein IT372_00670 [Polyangiaceae bacterium]|nr:hypothetical protein [Polyangiaceae bacterium]
MKSTMIYLVHLPLILCACLAAGCAADADNDAIWYDDGERACFAEGEDGDPVEVPCPGVASPPSKSLDDPIGACATPRTCNPIVIN